MWCVVVCVCVWGGGGLGAQEGEEGASYMYLNPLANKESLEQVFKLNYNLLICS